MTDHQAADYRRAAAIAVHHRNHDADGIAAIVTEANDLDRGADLIHAVLGLHSIIMARLRTTDGINLIADYIHGIATDQAGDYTRAARLIDHHGHENAESIAAELAAAATDNRIAEVFGALLNLYTFLLPELSSDTGIEWLHRHVHGLAGLEAQA